MNEKITTLVNHVRKIGCDDDNKPNTPMLVGNDIDKFVKIIVAECAEVYRTNAKSDRPLYPSEFSIALVNHFWTPV